ncbi:MAG: hypothetical protein K0B05_02990 [Bacteroidales bacterium]|nr:hypothetical protein [Bacteroidales bacterium]
MLQISVATHYCGGEAVATKVTLSGKTASCGMEDEGTEPFHGTLLKAHCCDDVIASYAIDTNFTPSFSPVTILFQTNSQVFSNSCEPAIHSFTHTKAINTNVRPAGLLMSTSVDLSDICVYRI